LAFAETADVRHLCAPSFAIRDPQSKLDNSGGIAQLVERQLCKLEVRGSNPLASNSIFDLRFAIVDLIKSSRSTSRGESKIGNRNSKFSGGAAKGGL
jgi:hypothetical protein